MTDQPSIERPDDGVRLELVATGERFDVERSAIRPDGTVLVGDELVRAGAWTECFFWRRGVTPPPLSRR